MSADQQYVYMCAEHNFVTVVRDAEVSCHGSPGRRATGCDDCDKAVDLAFARAARRPEAAR